MTYQSFAHFGVFRLFLASFMVLGLAACGKGTYSSAPKKVEQGNRKAEVAVQSKDLVGTWVVESLAYQEKPVYQLEKGVVEGSVKDIFGIEGDKDSKILMSINIDDASDIVMKVFKDGVEKSTVLGDFKMNRGVMAVKFEGDKTTDFKFIRNGNSVVMIDKDKRYTIKKVSTDRLKKNLEIHSKGKEIKLSDLNEPSTDA